jgi:hypothetical protein
MFRNAQFKIYWKLGKATLIAAGLGLRQKPASLAAPVGIKE